MDVTRHFAWLPWPGGRVVLLALLVACGVLIWMGRNFIGGVVISAGGMPAPAGPMTAGATTMEIAAGGSLDEPIVIDIWYPATVSAGAPLADITARQPSSLKRPGANSAVGQPMAAKTVPIVVYVPGWGSPRDDNTAALATLASHGYMVIALNDVGFDAHRRQPAPHHDARDQAAFDWSTDAAMARSIDIANWRLRRMTGRVSRVLNWLALRQDPGLRRLFSERLDFTRIGALGFSFGGSVAAELTKTDQRIVAALNMDGWFFGLSVAQGVERPLLVFNSDFPALLAAASSQNAATRLPAEMTLRDRAFQLRQMEQRTSLALVFKGVEHTDFTDELFMWRLGDYFGRWPRSSGDRLRLRATIDDLTVTFFDRTLRSAGADAQRPMPDGTYPGVAVLKR